MSESEPTMRERVSRERREAVAKAIHAIRPIEIVWTAEHGEAAVPFDACWPHNQECLRKAADAAIAAILPDRTAFFDAVDELVDVIKGFEPDSTIEDKKIALRDLVYGDDDASGGTR